MPEDGQLSDRGEPDAECPGCGAMYYSERAARGCCLIVDGGLEEDRPAFIGPNVSWVSCWICGEILTDLSRVEGIDVSDDDAYYPEMKPICPDHTTDEDGQSLSDERILEQRVEAVNRRAEGKR